MKWTGKRKTTKYDKITRKSQSVLVPNAIVKDGERKPYHERIVAPITNIECYEFGWSYAVQMKAPKFWMTSLKGHGRPIFIDMIRKQSPTSYLLRDNLDIPLPEDRNIHLQQFKFWNQFGEETRKIIEPLRSIYLIIRDGKPEITKPNDEHMKIFSTLELEFKGEISL